MSNHYDGGDRHGKRHGGAGRYRNNSGGGPRRGKGGPSSSGSRGGGRRDDYRSRDRFERGSGERRYNDRGRDGAKNYRDRSDERRGASGGYARNESGGRNERGHYRDGDRRASGRSNWRDGRDDRDRSRGGERDRNRGGHGGQRRRYDDERGYSSNRRGDGGQRDRGNWRERDEQRRDGGDCRGRSDRSRNERGERRYNYRNNDRNFDRGRSGGRGYRSESKRGGTEPRRDFSSRPHELRAIRETHIDPEIPGEITERDLPMKARVELKTLSHENYVTVARHLVMASLLIDTDPELAHAHALSASRRGGRVAMVREALAITAYRTGDYALALRELRTYRRISGRDDEIALMVDCERGLGRPDRAIELGQSVDRSTLDTQQQVLLAIAMSGARLDLGETELARAELEISQLDRTRAFSYSSALFRAYAAVLDDLGDSEATLWESAADRAEAALQAAEHNEFETVTIITERLETEPEEEAAPLAEESIETQIQAEYDELIAEVERAATDAAAADGEPDASEADALEADAESVREVAGDAHEGDGPETGESESDESVAADDPEASESTAAEPIEGDEPNVDQPVADEPEAEEPADTADEAADASDSKEPASKPATNTVLDDDQPSLFDL